MFHLPQSHRKFLLSSGRKPTCNRNNTAAVLPQRFTISPTTFGETFTKGLKDPHLEERPLRRPLTKPCHRSQPPGPSRIQGVQEKGSNFTD